MLFLLRCILLIVSFSAHAKFWPCTKYPFFPAILEVCSDATCNGLTYDRALKTQALYRRPDTASPTVGEIRACERIKHFSRHTRIRNPGLARVTYPNAKVRTLGVRPDDEIPLLRTIGEGFYVGCVGETIVDLAEASFGDAGDSGVEVVRQPDHDQWVRVTSEQGVMGYSDRSDFYMSSHDFEPKMFCSSDHPLGLRHEQVIAQLQARIRSSLRKQCADRECDLGDRCGLEKLFGEDFAAVVPKNVRCSTPEISQLDCTGATRASVNCQFDYRGRTNDVAFGIECDGDVGCLVN